MRVGSISIVLVAMLAASPLHARAACPPNITGDTIFWVIALCQARAETDDFESPAVQDCIENIASRNQAVRQPSTDCKSNAVYKRAWCETMVKNGVEPSVSECVKSSTAIPPVVRNGQVGN